MYFQYDLHIGNKKVKSKAVNAKSQKVGMLLERNSQITSPILRSVRYIKTTCKFDDVTVKASVSS